MFIFIPLLFNLLHCSPQQSGRGHLLIIGGGSKPIAAIEQFIDYCHGESILIITSASGIPDEVGPETVNLFKEVGANNVSYLHIADSTEANSDSVVSKIKEARGIFFTGGVQSRLMDKLGNTKTSAEILQKYARGNGIIGGTSAGAAVMSSIMITGDGDFNILKKDNIVTADGFGFLHHCIIDQHFVRLRRNNRLLSLVIEHGLPGIGVDEATAIFYHPDDTFDVYGEGSVIVYDPRHSKQPKTGELHNLAIADLRLSVLSAGHSFDLKRGKFVEKYHGK